MGSAKVRLTVIPPPKGQWMAFYNSINRNRDPWDYSQYPYLERDYDYVSFFITSFLSKSEMLCIVVHEEKMLIM